ncbi:AraC family transcriptional regulator [Actinoallomurus iriomotensis]|uniref:AraC family transcriptional regulator n=1 Tax=Actinoallomurus iriomotensis TaxID=478107 RepID=A0A9W6S8X7_9ACTN|nr:AraC family transcriptional regulator [Actinoallomurus iriomotensis]GLY89539.1 AraC family transcriptional regulator [Actinoallomurus iriomotensis]
MLSSVPLAGGPDFSVATVRCAEHRPGWSPPEQAGRHQVVLVRSGRFRLRSEGRDALADPTAGYLQVPGDLVSFAHPAGGDVCTAVTFSPALWRSVAGDDRRPASASVYLDGRLQLAHRRLLRAAPDVAFAMAEQLVGLLDGLLRGPGRRLPRRGGGRTLADEAREALLTDHPEAGGLIPLARLLGVSPSHLSRTFQHETGTSLTRYRNRIRVTRALDHIEQGADHLAGIAADLGFADQAHLCRTVRTELGHTPTEVRRLLGA